MGTPAIVMGDKIMGTCAIHTIPNPATGVPQPSPPLPFSAPVTVGVCPTVMIAGKAAAVVGCTGYNTPPHVGLFPADPYMVPIMQVGTIMSGSATVLIGGQPAATASSSCTCCATPGSITPTVTSVLIG
jgi:uncharacterized Zn-binding protein involved in type VI secretion